MSDSERLEINWTNAAGAALGAVSAAVVLSTLGTAGTLLGAALGSLCITIGGAVYSHSLRRTQRRLAATRALAARRQGRQSRGFGGPPVDPTTGSTGQSTEVLEPEAGASENWTQTLRGLPWKRIGLISAALFAVTVAVIVVFELAIGRPVSSLTGGTDNQTGTIVPGLGRDTGSGGSEQGERRDPPVDVPEEGEPEPPAEQPTPAPVEEPTEPALESATAEPTPSPAQSTG